MKGELTRQRIIEQAAVLFNRRGYASISVSDLMAATGLKKGGLYGHFKSKDELAAEAFDHAVKAFNGRLREALLGVKEPRERLKAMVRAFSTIATNPPIEGGCPVLNTAIENDDGNMELRERAVRAAKGWGRLVTKTLYRGKQRGQIDREVDEEEVATILISTLEGAIMLTRLHKDPKHVNRAIVHLESYIDRI